MIPSNILKKIRLIEIKTRNMVDNIFGGEYHSTFKGTGMEFAEVREYYPGDDIRNIDWNVTARMGKPYIKKFDEERELNIVLLVDLSCSNVYGSKNSLKSDIIVELSSILSLSAIKNNDKVSLLLFTDKIELYIPPNKGKSHVLRVIREIIYHKPDALKTDISFAVDYLQKVIKRKSIVFLLSDFIDDGFKKSLKLLNKKHDLICMNIYDPSETIFPQLGLFKMHDAESKKTIWVDSNPRIFKELMRNKSLKRIDSTISFFKKNKIDYVDINTSRDYVAPLVEFFNKRS